LQINKIFKKSAKLFDFGTFSSVIFHSRMNSARFSARCLKVFLPICKIFRNEKNFSKKLLVKRSEEPIIAESEIVVFSWREVVLPD